MGGAVWGGAAGAGCSQLYASLQKKKETSVKGAGSGPPGDVKRDTSAK